MDTILIDAWDQHEYATKHTATFDYQQGYEDGMEESERMTRELRLTVGMILFIFVAFFMNIIVRKRFR